MNTLISRRQGLAWALASLAPASVLGLPGRAQAATAAWPTKPLRIVVPYPAGGTPDMLARQLGPSLQSQLGQPVVVEAKPGASGLIAARMVSKGAPDAHNFMSLSSGIVTLSAMNPKFDLLAELKPVTRLTTSPFVCVVATGSRIQSMGELIEVGRSKPGSLTYGSAGSGSPAHLAVEYLADSTGNFKALHVPYKGA
ncbi:MAG: tripartite tricarboxylate transporter substrate binding protein, partial [Variovorax sp.]|nr:tripartite tricarboxylate transporter substrate binding protein [Variovorax sp.]